MPYMVVCHSTDEHNYCFKLFLLVNFTNLFTSDCGKVLLDCFQLLFSAECHLTEEQLLEGIISLCDRGELPALEICQRVRQFQEVSKSINIDLCQRGPVILVLDKVNKRWCYYNMQSTNFIGLTSVHQIL